MSPLLTKPAYVIWATSWVYLFMPYANNKSADQPAHPRSLISTFIVRSLDSDISSFYIGNLASVPSFSLIWSQTPKTGFLMTRLIREQQRCRSVCASYQSDQCLCYLLYKKYNSCRSFLLAEQTGLSLTWFPISKDRFSHDLAYMLRAASRENLSSGFATG